MSNLVLRFTQPPIKRVSGDFSVAERRASVDPGGPVVIILATGSEVRGLKPGRGRWIFSERKNPEYDFLRKETKPVGLVS